MEWLETKLRLRNIHLIFLVSSKTLENCRREGKLAGVFLDCQVKR